MQIHEGVKVVFGGDAAGLLSAANVGKAVHQPMSPVTMTDCSCWSRVPALLRIHGRRPTGETSPTPAATSRRPPGDDAYRYRDHRARPLRAL